MSIWCWNKQNNCQSTGWLSLKKNFTQSWTKNKHFLRSVLVDVLWSTREKVFCLRLGVLKIDGTILLINWLIAGAELHKTQLLFAISVKYLFNLFVLYWVKILTDFQVLFIYEIDNIKFKCFVTNCHYNHTIDCNRHCTVSGVILWLPATL